MPLALGYINSTHSNYHHYTTVHMIVIQVKGLSEYGIQTFICSKENERERTFCQGGYVTQQRYRGKDRRAAPSPPITQCP